MNLAGYKLLIVPAPNFVPVLNQTLDKTIQASILGAFWLEQAHSS